MKKGSPGLRDGVGVQKRGAGSGGCVSPPSDVIRVRSEGDVEGFVQAGLEGGEDAGSESGQRITTPSQPEALDRMRW